MTCMQHKLPVPGTAPAVLMQPLTPQASFEYELAVCRPDAAEIEYASWMLDPGAIEVASWAAHLRTALR